MYIYSNVPKSIILHFWRALHVEGKVPPVKSRRSRVDKKKIFVYLPPYLGNRANYIYMAGSVGKIVIGVTVLEVHRIKCY